MLRNEKLVRLWTEDGPIYDKVNLLKLVNLPTSKDGLYVTPSVADFLEKIVTMQGFFLNNGNIEFIVNKNAQVSNRIPVNYY